MSDGVGAYSLGVDLGTTFVAAAVARGSRVEMITLGDRTVVAPAVVYVRDDGSLVTGEAANRRAVSNPDRVGREFKRRLGDPTPVMLGGTPHAVTSLLAALLADTVAKVTETEGAPPANVVLTHPANWGPYRRELFEEVPQLAGVPQVRMITEPEAAAAHYAAARHLADGDTVAVYDLGGGTFDATVLRKRGGVNGRHRHPRQPRGHRAARRRRLRRRDPRPHQLQLRRRAERAGPEQPADRHRPGPAAAGLHRGEGGALDRHRGVHPGVPAEPPLRRPPDARRVRRHDPRPDRVDDRRADPHAAIRARRARRPQRGAAGRRLLPDPARRPDDHGGAQPAHPRRRAPQVRRRARCGHGRCRARRAGGADGRRRPGIGPARRPPMRGPCPHRLPRPHRRLPRPSRPTRPPSARSPRPPRSGPAGSVAVRPRAGSRRRRSDPWTRRRGRLRPRRIPASRRTRTSRRPRRTGRRRGTATADGPRRRRSRRLPASPAPVGPRRHPGRRRTAGSLPSPPADRRGVGRGARAAGRRGHLRPPPAAVGHHRCHRQRPHPDTAAAARAEANPRSSSRSPRACPSRRSPGRSRSAARRATSPSCRTARSPTSRTARPASSPSSTPRSTRWSRRSRCRTARRSTSRFLPTARGSTSACSRTRTGRSTRWPSSTPGPTRCSQRSRSEPGPTRWPCGRTGRRSTSRTMTRARSR